MSNKKKGKGDILIPAAWAKIVPTIGIILAGIVAATSVYSLVGLLSDTEYPIFDKDFYVASLAKLVNRNREIDAFMADYSNWMESARAISEFESSDDVLTALTVMANRLDNFEGAVSNIEDTIQVDPSGAPLLRYLEQRLQRPNREWSLVRGYAWELSMYTCPNREGPAARRKVLQRS